MNYFKYDKLKKNNYFRNLIAEKKLMIVYDL